MSFRTSGKQNHGDRSNQKIRTLGANPLPHRFAKRQLIRAPSGERFGAVAEEIAIALRPLRMSIVACDPVAQLEELSRIVLVRRRRRTKNEATEVLQQVVKFIKSRIAGSPQ